MRSHRVLVVDAECGILDLLATGLAHEAVSLNSVPAGAEALAALDGAGFDLVVAAWRLPGMSGLQLRREIGRAYPAMRVMLVAESASPADLLRALRQRVWAYVSMPIAPLVLADLVLQACQDETWEDDLTLLSGTTEWITLLARCRIVLADRLTHVFREMLAGLPRDTADDILAAARELLMNAIEHGGGSNPAKQLRVSLVRARHAVTCYVQDPGHGFSFRALEHAAVSNPSGDPTRHAGRRSEEGRRPGGFGILLARNLVDELIYNEQGNEVLFIKFLP